MAIFDGSTPIPDNVGRIAITLVDDTYLGEDGGYLATAFAIRRAGSDRIDRVDVHNLVPHMTNEERTAILAFMQRIRTVATTELLP